MIRLFTSSYAESSMERAAELQRALDLNLSNRFIGEIVLLREANGPCPPRAKCIPIDKRPTYRNFFDLINRLTGDKDVNVLANSDIAFDDTALSLGHITHQEAYAITRCEKHGDSTKIIQGPDSQDVWVFKGRIRDVNCDFEMGRPGCDNRLVWELRKAGYVVSNPCLTVKVLHIHESGLRNNSVPVSEPYDWAHHVELIPVRHQRSVSSHARKLIKRHSR